MKKDLTIGEIVAIDYRTASIFKEAGIDFCDYIVNTHPSPEV
jgi:hypothetical protein